jgi:DNA-binding NarL/FixJ family response regulator
MRRTRLEDWICEVEDLGALDRETLGGLQLRRLNSLLAREAARGGSIIAPDVASKVLQMFSRMAQGDVQVRVNKKNALELTKMEWQVIREVGCGLSNKEIAGRLYLSEGTVRNYISSILRKLELRDRTQLAIWAVQNQNSQPEADV